MGQRHCLRINGNVIYNTFVTYVFRHDGLNAVLLRMLIHLINVAIPVNAYNNNINNNNNNNNNNKIFIADAVHGPY